MDTKKAPEGANRKTYIDYKSKTAKSQITSETRMASYEKKPNQRQKEILSFIEKEGKATARKIVEGLGYTDMNAVRPRLTELLAQKKIVAVDKELDHVTNRAVTVYAIREDGND